MPEMIWVRAKHGFNVPRHDAGTRYIDATPVEVPHNAYYERRLRDDEIERCDAPTAPKTKEK